MGVSMFQSALGTSFWEGGAQPSGETTSLPPRLIVKSRSLRERQQRRLLMASEILLKAQLSIDEVNLSLSSRGNPRPSSHVPRPTVALPQNQSQYCVSIGKDLRCNVVLYIALQ